MLFLPLHCNKSPSIVVTTCIIVMEHMCVRCARLFLQNTRSLMRPLSKPQVRGLSSSSSRFAQGTTNLHNPCAEFLTICVQAHSISRHLCHLARETKLPQKHRAKAHKQKSLHAFGGSVGDHRNPEQLNLDERALETQDRLQASFFDEQATDLLLRISARSNLSLKAKPVCCVRTGMLFCP